MNLLLQRAKDEVAKKYMRESQMKHGWEFQDWKEYRNHHTGEHIEQSFDHVEFQPDLYDTQVEITAYKNGKQASKTIEFHYAPWGTKSLDNLKYELLKEL